MATDGITMKGDKVLDADINKATSFADLQALLHNAVERSSEVGFTRDEVTGRFIPREPSTPNEQAAANDAADKAAANAPREFKKTEVIGGRNFDFVASSAEALQLQIDSARSVADALTSHEDVTPRSARAAAARNAEQDVLDKVDADMALRRGEISTTEYLERTHAIEDALAARGVDIDKLSHDQFNQSWQEATTQFLNSDAGSSWPGGLKNRQILSDKLAAMGLVDAPDKVSALAQAYAALKRAGTLFDGDYSSEQINALTANATPQEILQAWKELHGGAGEQNADAINARFIENHRRSGSSGLFGK